MSSSSSSSFSSSTSMHDGDEISSPSILLVFIGVTFGFLVGPWMLWEALWNFPRKRRLLDQYAQTGVAVRGAITRQQLIRHRTNFLETYQTHRFQYAYQAPGENEIVYVKQHTHYYLALLCQSPTLIQTPVIVITVLPGIPQSGYPYSYVERRHQMYGAVPMAIRALWAIVAMVCGVVALCNAVDDRNEIIPGQVPGHDAIYILWLGIFMGYPLAACSHRMWRRNLLLSVHQALRPLAPQQAEPLGTTEPSTWMHDDTRVPEMENQEESEDATLLATIATTPTTERAARVLSVVDSNGEEGAIELAPQPLQQQQRQEDCVDPIGLEILKQAQNLNLERLLSTLSQQQSGDVRFFYLQLAVTRWGNQTCTDVVNCPDTTVGNLWKGAYWIQRAWDLGDSGAASSPTSDRRPETRQRLQRAQEALLRAAELDPQDATPYVCLVMGPARDPSQMTNEMEWYQAAIARDPENLAAHWAHLTFLSPNHQAMYGFARETIERTPRDSPLQVLLLEAFYQHGMYLIQSRDSTGLSRFLQDTSILEAARSIYKVAVKQRQIRHGSDCRIHATAALCLWILDEIEPLQLELNKLRPWRLFLFDKLLLLVLDDFARAKALRVRMTQGEPIT